MELVKTNEDLIVLEYLYQMKVNAEIKAESGSLTTEKNMWFEHLEVINRAIQANEPESISTKKTA